MRDRFIAAVAALCTTLVVACSTNDLAAADVAAAATIARISNEEQARTIEALRPPKRERPVIAVLGDNAGTETTDFMIPYGVLSESNLADVIAVAPEAGPIKLMPALTILPQQTIEAFDALYPGGADYVVVPAMHHTDRPVVLKWIRAQSDTGAIIVAICSGAMVVSETGLLENHAATTHWFDIDQLERDNPTMTRVNNRRYVVDRAVVTTTGVSASIPISLALVEAIGGRIAAVELAQRLGVRDWSAYHESSTFQLRWRSVSLAARNLLAFWSHERIGITVQSGVDEISLAVIADAYSRTFRSKAFAVAEGPGMIRTKRGLQLLPDDFGPAPKIDHFAPFPDSMQPVLALNRVLQEIRCRYSENDAAFVALQLEYTLGAWLDSEKGTSIAGPAC